MAKGVINDQTRMGATSLATFSSFSRVRDRASAILDVLWVQPDHEIRDKGGRATTILHEKLPPQIGRTLNPHSLVGQLKTMEDVGFITRAMNGKRTHAIQMGKRPTDWVPPITQEPAEVPVQLEEGPPSNGDTPYEPAYEPSGKMETIPVESYEEEAREGGIRPGRLAARLEKIERTIPALVEEGVVAGINGWFTQIAVALGYTQQVVDTSDLDQLTMALAALEELNAGLQDDLRAERQSNIAAREELNRVLRGTVATKETSPVRPNDLQEQYRGLATHAIANGWTLHRTGGGHIMWKAPNGQKYFTASTSSDYRAVRNARSDMEKLGLPKE